MRRRPQEITAESARSHLSHDSLDGMSDWLGKKEPLGLAWDDPTVSRPTNRKLLTVLARVALLANGFLWRLDRRMWLLANLIPLLAPLALLGNVIALRSVTGPGATQTVESASFLPIAGGGLLLWLLYSHARVGAGISIYFLRRRVQAALEAIIVLRVAGLPAAELEQRTVQRRLHAARGQLPHVNLISTGSDLIYSVLSAFLLAVAVLWLQPLWAPLIVLLLVVEVGGEMSVVRRFMSVLATSIPASQLRAHDAAVLLDVSRSEEVRGLAITPFFGGRYQESLELEMSGLGHLRSSLTRVAVIRTTLTAVVLAIAVVILSVTAVEDQGLITVVASSVLLVVFITRLRAVGGAIGVAYNEAVIVDPILALLSHTQAPGSVARPGLAVDGVAPQSPLEGHAAFDDQLNQENVAQLDHVWFRYPESAEFALKDVSLDIRRGETVALVGPNGAGKTTVVKMLLRLYEPNRGTLEVRGLPGVVFQDFGRYEATVLENILFGRSFDQNNLGTVLDLSGVSRLCEDEGLQQDSWLGRLRPSGRQLSTGQWQRMAIARALSLDSSGLVVLDEPTASLDPLEEKRFFQSVDHLKRTLGVLLISHRSSTVAHADRTYVLEGGQIIQQGTHRELLAIPGMYRDMFEAPNPDAGNSL